MTIIDRPRPATTSPQPSVGAALAHGVIVDRDVVSGFAERYCRSLPDTAEMDAQSAEALFAQMIVPDFSEVRRYAREVGMSKEDLAAALKPLTDMLCVCLLVRRAQQKPRGYPGDFETIEVLLGRQGDSEPGTWGALFDAHALRCDAVQQHHNKIAHQASLISSALAGGPSRPGRRILLLASGGAADLRQVDPALVREDDLIVLNDMDPDALSYAMQALPGPIAARTITVAGNSVRKAADLGADHGPFDLVLAGGLFDYLPQRYARALIGAAMTLLCRPGGTFYYSNIAAGNPFGAFMELVQDWCLIERAESEIEEDVRAAAGDQLGQLSVRREATGLTFLVEVQRAG